MKKALATTWLLFLLAYSGLALSDCGNAHRTSVSDLQGKWVLESIDGKAIRSDPEIYFEINGRSIAGFDGCNSFGGSIDAPEDLRMTQRACPSDAPRLPLRFSELRSQLESSELKGETLELTLPDDTGKARLRRSDRSGETS